MLSLFQPFGASTTTHRILIRVFWVALFFVVWQWWPGYLIPRPLGTMRQLARLYNNGLMVELWVSSSVIIRAACVAFPLGCTLSYCYTIPVFRPVVLFYATLRNASMTAWVAAFIMMSLGGDLLKVVTMTVMISLYFVSSVIQHFDELSQDDIDDAVSMRMSPWQVLWHCVVRGKLHVVCFDFIPCLGMGWAMLSFVEGLARDQGGLGDIMLQVDKISSFEGILVLAMVSVAFGFGMWFVLRSFVRRFFRYAVQVAVGGGI